MLIKVTPHVYCPAPPRLHSNPGLLQDQQLHRQGQGLDVRWCVWCSYFWRSWGGMSFKMNLWKKIQTNETPCDSKAWKIHKISKCHPVWLSQVRVQPRMSAGCQQGSLLCLHEGRSARISTGWDKYVETQQLECGLCIFRVYFGTQDEIRWWLQFVFFFISKIGGR